MLSIEETLAQALSVKTHQVEAAVRLLDEGATVPFIARYRKEATGSLDDAQLRQLQELLEYHRSLEERRATILASISNQGKLTEALEQAIKGAPTKHELEDLYLPFKPKRVTKGEKAKQAGLLPLAQALLSAQQSTPEVLAEAYINAEKGVPDAKAALEGARYILMETVAEQAVVLKQCRGILLQNSLVFSTLVAGKEKEASNFQDYFEYQERYQKIPSHRALAILRGRQAGFLKIKVDLDPEDTQTDHACEAVIADYFKLKTLESSASTEQLAWLNELVRWSWKLKLQPRLETELLQDLKEKADEDAIKVFAGNLKDVLLASPAGAKVTLGLDPGFRTGVKVVVVDVTGKLLKHTTIYPHEPQKKWDESLHILAQLCDQYPIELVAIGNGTASRETDKLVNALRAQEKYKALQKIIVSEAGASVYSASALATQEFPKLDVSFRGAVSIARRLQDPLAELVKIEPKSIGVGQYQHDVDQSKLSQTLDRVVEDCVNAVGVDVNMASASLLERVSGINKAIASNIVQLREQNGPYSDRESFRKIPRFGEKTFEQAAGFLRIIQGCNPLDASAVHPEAYPLVQVMAERLGLAVENLIGNIEAIRTINPNDFVSEAFGLPTITDILKELEKPGRDPRSEFKVAQFAEDVQSIEDVCEGMLLEGNVTNVTQFGVFVDIGVHLDGMVHVSELGSKFIKDPREKVKAGDVVKVRVKKVDKERKRIELSMKPIAKDKPGKDKHRKSRSQSNSQSNPSREPKRDKKPQDHAPRPHTPTLADLFAKAKTIRSK